VYYGELQKCVIALLHCFSLVVACVWGYVFVLVCFAQIWIFSVYWVVSCVVVVRSGTAQSTYNRNAHKVLQNWYLPTTMILLHIFIQCYYMYLCV